MEIEPVFIQSNEGMDGTAGHYQRHSNQKKIVIKYKNNYNSDIILSIIAHEISHCFLDMHNVRFEKEIDNEILTDTCAVYLGYGDFLRKGYEKLEYTEEHFSYSSKVTEKIGYISADEVRMIINKIKIRKELNEIEQEIQDEKKNVNQPALIKIEKLQNIMSNKINQINSFGCNNEKFVSIASSMEKLDEEISELKRQFNMGKALQTVQELEEKNDILNSILFQQRNNHNITNPSLKKLIKLLDNLNNKINFIQESYEYVNDTNDKNFFTQVIDNKSDIDNSINKIKETFIEKECNELIIKLEEWNDVLNSIIIRIKKEL